MAIFNLAALSETFLLLMNTPLVPPDSSNAPRDVPLTEMPSRLDRGTRRRSNSSSMNSSTQSSPYSTGTTLESLDDSLGWSRDQGSVSLSAMRSRSPPSVESKKLPPLPPPRHSRVRFADDCEIEGPA
ncbi:hypothetical protein DFH11DRAFT_1726661 [Phellopilus nigrolimitatus]|nr:hypothetical protein DFH11DRAFT_1726661 [Phellopilus nigrolimitatus]